MRPLMLLGEGLSPVELEGMTAAMTDESSGPAQEPNTDARDYELAARILVRISVG